jgi:hypothetical protein
VLSRRCELPDSVSDTREQHGSDHGGECQPDSVTTARPATASRPPVAVASGPVSPGRV